MTSDRRPCTEWKLQTKTMKNPRSVLARWIVPALLLTTLFNGCSAPQKRPQLDHAYLVYWPPPEGTNQLRLAVKDLIDMKGVVTTAGSEYFAKYSPPAPRDAKCLEIARERNISIVGKTNLTELGVGVSGINGYFGTPRNP